MERSWKENSKWCVPSGGVTHPRTKCAQCCLTKQTVSVGGIVRGIPPTLITESAVT